MQNHNRLCISCIVIDLFDCMVLESLHSTLCMPELTHPNISNMQKMYFGLYSMWPLTLPLSKLRAADSSDCGIKPFSAPNVLTTDDTADGIDKPCEFSARTKNMYDVAGFSSPIWKWKKIFHNKNQNFSGVFFFVESVETTHFSAKLFNFVVKINVKLTSFNSFYVC